MRSNMLLSLLTAVVAWSGYVQGSPIRCPDMSRDLILNGQQPPEICCSYGQCKGDVVIRSG